MKISAQRDANTARALVVVMFGHRPPARPLSQTHRQDRLQYTAPQIASAQCNYYMHIKIEQMCRTRSEYKRLN